MVRTNRELDVLIAEKVFGSRVDFLNQQFAWRIDYVASDPVCNNALMSDSCIEGYQLKKYSESIEDAWQIIEKFHYFKLGTTTVGDMAMEMYFCELFNGKEYVMAIGETPMIAICNAALRAVEYE